MPEPSPAKTNMSIEMNSASAAFSAEGLVASPGIPTAILLIGIFTTKKKNKEEKFSLFFSFFSVD